MNVPNTAATTSSLLFSTQVTDLCAGKLLGALQGPDSGSNANIKSRIIVMVVVVVEPMTVTKSRGSNLPANPETSLESIARQAQSEQDSRETKSQSVGISRQFALEKRADSVENNARKDRCIVEAVVSNATMRLGHVMDA